MKVTIVDSGVHPRQGALHPVGGLNTLDGGDPNLWWIDEKGHGTHCAGLIAGRVGVPGGVFVGIAPHAELYSVKVFPGGFVSDLVEAIDWRVDQRMDIVNLSLGSPQYSPALSLALARAYAVGVTVITASGNEATHVTYPALMKLGVFSVGAVVRNGSFPADSAHSLKIGRYQDPSGRYFAASFSNFGEELDVIAPGVAITSTVPNGFAAWDGTSIACRLVTGVAAQVLSASPWLRRGDGYQVDLLLHCLRDPMKFPDLNHAVKRDPRTNLRSAKNNWDFWTSLPEALHQITIVMSDRGIPATYRHMHGFGSHTFSFII